MTDILSSLNRSIRFFEKLTAEKKLIKSADNSKLDDLFNGAKQHGLVPEDIITVTNIIRNGCVPKRKRSKVLKCLLPRNFIPIKAVLNLVSWMNTDAAESVNCVFILQWILDVFDFIDDLDVVHSLYSVFFQLLKADKLRKLATGLLILITKPEDVHLYRVQRLLRLRNVLGNDINVINLLLLYKSYRPHLVNIHLPNSKLFPPRPSWWAECIRDLKTRNVNVSVTVPNTFCNPKMFWEAEDSTNFHGTISANKRIKLDEYLPVLRNDPGSSVISKSKENIDSQPVITLSSISSIDQIFKYIQRIKLPSRSFSILRYPILHILISCFKNEEFVTRFNYRLSFVLYQDFAVSSKDANYDSEMNLLDKFSRLCEFLQEGSIVMEHFLSYYLAYIWNGRDHAGYILKLITRLQIRDMSDLEGILVPLKRVFCSSIVRFKVAILQTLYSLLENYLTREINRHKDPGPGFNFFLHEERKDLDVDKALNDFISYINDLCTIGLELEKDNLDIIHIALDLHKLITKLPLIYDIAIIKLPPPILVHSAFLSFDPFALSKVCSLLCSWSIAFQKFKLLLLNYSNANQDLQLDEKYIAFFNAYTKDFCDALWRLKAFTRTNKAISAFNVPDSVFQQLDQDDMRKAFLLPRHPALIRLAVRFQEENVPDEPQFFTETSLKSPSMNEFRDFLNGIGLAGISEFLDTFIVEMSTSIQ